MHLQPQPLRTSRPARTVWMSQRHPTPKLSMQFTLLLTARASVLPISSYWPPYTWMLDSPLPLPCVQFIALSVTSHSLPQAAPQGPWQGGHPRSLPLQSSRAPPSELAWDMRDLGNGYPVTAGYPCSQLMYTAQG